MGEVFEGIFCKCAAAKLREAARLSCKSNHQLFIHELSDSLSAVFRLEPKVDLQFSPLMDELASNLSRHVDAVVLARYDSTTDFAEANVYQEGAKILSFGEENELWVPYSDEGELLEETEPTTIREMEPDREYDCVKNAIEIGVEAIGVAYSANVMPFVTNSWRVGAEALE